VRLRENEPDILKLRPREYIEKHVLASKRALYLEEFENFLNDYNISPKYSLFVKSNEPNVITDGVVGNEKPRFVINPEGIKGIVGPVMHTAVDMMGKIIPSFKARNADSCSALLQEKVLDRWIAADGSNWDSTQYL